MTNAFVEKSEKDIDVYGHFYLELWTKLLFNPCPAEPRYTLPLQTV